MSCYPKLYIGFFSLMYLACAPVDTSESTGFTGHFLHLASATIHELEADTSSALYLQFELDKGYHIVFDSAELTEEGLTQLVLQENEAITFGRPIFPKPIDYQLQGLETSLSVFKNTLTLKVPIQIPAIIKAQEGCTISGSFYYQACDHQKCYFQRAYQFEFSLLLNE